MIKCGFDLFQVRDSGSLSTWSAQEATSAKLSLLSNAFTISFDLGVKWFLAMVATVLWPATPQEISAMLATANKVIERYFFMPIKVKKQS
jgi:hypothetical protein